MSNFNYDKYKVTFYYRRKRKYLLIFLILVLYFPMNDFYIYWNNCFSIFVEHINKNFAGNFTVNV